MYWRLILPEVQSTIFARAECQEKRLRAGRKIDRLVDERYDARLSETQVFGE